VYSKESSNRGKPKRVDTRDYNLHLIVLVEWTEAARVDELRDRAMIREVEFEVKRYGGQVSHSFLLETLVR